MAPRQPTGAILLGMEPDNKPKQVLLVDDDRTLREMYAVALVKAGLDIIMAENGVQGIEMALKHKPDVILLDIEMPEMDGRETPPRQLGQDCQNHLSHQP